MRRLLLLVVLLAIGCGDDAPKSAIVSSQKTEAPPPVPALGIVEGAGKQVKPGWSIAFWNEEENELVLCFLEAAPKAEALNTIRDLKSLRGTFGVPAIEFGVKFEMDSGLPDIAAPTWYRAVYLGFPGGAVNFIEPAGPAGDWDVRIRGNPVSDGSVQGHIAGAGYMSFSPGPERGDYYGWNLDFKLLVD